MRVQTKKNRERVCMEKMSQRHMVDEKKGTYLERQRKRGKSMHGKR